MKEKNHGACCQMKEWARNLNGRIPYHDDLARKLLQLYAHFRFSPLKVLHRVIIVSIIYLDLHKLIYNVKLNKSVSAFSKTHHSTNNNSNIHTYTVVIISNNIIVSFELISLCNNFFLNIILKQSWIAKSNAVRHHFLTLWFTLLNIKKN